MLGFRFEQLDPNHLQTAPFDRLFDIFQELLTYTSGDVAEALSWLTELDREYELTTDDYGIADFIEDLKRKGYIEPDEPGQSGGMRITAKMEREIRKRSLEEIFGQLKKGGAGNHNTKFAGQGDDVLPERRPYLFGDKLEQISLTDSLRNAQINHGIDDFHLTQEDLEVMETEYKTQTSTVLMIDISHSMILYGEDRITPAKKVAMALSELIMTRYPKDSLDVIVFGNDAWPIKIKDLPYLQVGPYHTNTVAGLELAIQILRRKRHHNKQIFMITDGKPTCIKQGKNYYKNSFGLDRKIINRTINLARQCKKMNIPVTTFMIARDPWLVQFVERFTFANQGKAYYSSLHGLGEYIFKDYEQGKRKRLK